MKAAVVILALLSLSGPGKSYMGRTGSGARGTLGMTAGFPIVQHSFGTTGDISSGTYTVTSGKFLVVVGGTDTADSDPTLSNSYLSAGTLTWSRIEVSTGIMAPQMAIWVGTLTGASSASVITLMSWDTSNAHTRYMAITSWDNASTTAGVHSSRNRPGDNAAPFITLSSVSLGSIVMGGVWDYSSSTTRTLRSDTNDPSDTMLWNDTGGGNTVEALYSNKATSSTVTIGWTEPTGPIYSAVAVEIQPL